MVVLIALIALVVGLVLVFRGDPNGKGTVTRIGAVLAFAGVAVLLFAAFHYIDINNWPPQAK